MDSAVNDNGPPPLPTLDVFLRALTRSGLLAENQLQDILRQQPANPESLATLLVRRGKLTAFQARKLLEGKTLGLVLGHYQVLAPIGRGGMGAVYLARDDRSQQLVALKVLPPQRARQEQHLLERFRREMALCQLVEHPNLARTYEVGSARGVYFIAMEYIAGQSLWRLVNDQGPIEVLSAVRLFAEVAAALDHAHGKGLVHRDLKPSNIRVTRDGHAKVLDLGLAILQGETAGDRSVVGGEGFVVGTMDYLPPEQAEDATRVDARGDLYALGCTMYFALTGRPPFPGGTTSQKILRHLKEEPTPVERLNPAIAAPLAQLIKRLLAKKPADRPPSALAVQSELLTWMTPTTPAVYALQDDVPPLEAEVVDPVAEALLEELAPPSQDDDEEDDADSRQQWEQAEDARRRRRRERTVAVLLWVVGICVVLLLLLGLALVTFFAPDR
jgi:serine/threonine protein kinase